MVLKLQSFESWQNLRNVKIGFNLGMSSGQIMLSWQNLHQNDVHSIYCLTISTLLVTSRTDLELYGLTSTIFLQYWNTQSPVSFQWRRRWWWDSHQNNAHSVYVLMIFTLSVTSHTKFKVILIRCCEILRINVNISEDSDRTYSKEAHSLYFLMIPACYSSDVLFVFGVLKIISTQV